MDFTRSLANKLQMPEDQIRLIVAVLISTPLSYVLYFLPGRTFRMLYSLIFGTLLQLFVYYEYKTQNIIILVQTILVYFVCKYSRKNCGLIVTVESIIMLSGFHLHRQITDYGSWNLDTTTILMNLICKYSEFAYAYQDGGATYRLNAQQKQLKISTLPSLFQYICYIQFLPTTIMGPSCQYIQYQKYISRQKRSPNPIFEIGKSLISAVFFLVLYLFVYEKYCSVQYMKTQEFLNSSFWYMFFYSAISVTFIRTKYYFAWKLCSCNVHASGVTYKQIKKQNGQIEQSFSNLNHANPYTVESTYHIRDKIANWNMSCQAWLRKCIYLRYANEQVYRTNKGVQAKGQLVVFMISAFWHGFYGGYYLSFFFWFMVQHLSTLIFKITMNYPIISKTYEKTGIIGHILLWIFANSFFSHFGLFFQLLSLKDGLRILSHMNYITVILLMTTVIILQFSGLQNKKKPKAT